MAGQFEKVRHVFVKTGLSSIVRQNGLFRREAELTKPIVKGDVMLRRWKVGDCNFLVKVALGGGSDL